MIKDYRITSKMQFEQQLKAAGSKVKSSFMSIERPIRKIVAALCLMAVFIHASSAAWPASQLALELDATEAGRIEVDPLALEDPPETFTMEAHFMMMEPPADGYASVFSSRVELAKPDWPMWRFDAARSASTPHNLAEELHLQWIRELPEPQRAWRHQWDDQSKLDFDVAYSPVVMGDIIFVPSNVTDSLTAYSIENGREKWRFYADGPVRLAPAARDGRVYFTSDDGYLYCVHAETGELEWKFRGGLQSIACLAMNA